MQVHMGNPHMINSNKNTPDNPTSNTKEDILLQSITSKDGEAAMRQIQLQNEHQQRISNFQSTNNRLRTRERDKKKNHVFDEHLSENLPGAPEEEVTLHNKNKLPPLPFRLKLNLAKENTIDSSDTESD